MNARLVSVLASMAFSVAALSGAAPAQAEPVPSEQQFYVTDQGFGQDFYDGPHVVTAAHVLFQSPNGIIPPDSYADVTWTSCGRVVQSWRHDLPVHPEGKSTTGFFHQFSPDGEINMGENSVNRRIGNAFGWSATIVHPGYDPYVLSGTMTTRYPRPSCEEILADEDESAIVTVHQWSAKKGTTTAKVGKRLAVTPTRASGAEVTYAWKVGTKVVDRDRYMKVKKAYRGKPVTLRITVSKSGAKSASKVLRYGKAR